MDKPVVVELIERKVEEILVEMYFGEGSVPDEVAREWADLFEDEDG